MSSTAPHRAYLDHAATTDVRAEVIAVVAEQMAQLGNASSLHGSGRAARKTVEESRERIAAALGASPSEVVLTSGGTEADNLAVKGFLWARRHADPARRRVITSAVEHHAVIDPVQWLDEYDQADVTYVGVDRAGRLDTDAYAAAIAADPASVAVASVMWANNEIGTLQPIADVVSGAREHGIPTHSDAVQALGQTPLDFGACGLDAMTVTGHKIGGPHGVGALLLRREARLVPLSHGGGQERDIRSGTLDVPLVAGFALATELAVAEREQHHAHLSTLAERLVNGVQQQVPDAVHNGPDGDDRLPGVCHFSFPGCQGDSLLMLLDAQGIECSTGSACSAGVPQASHVLLAMGYDDAEARSSLRFSLGRTSTEADVDRLVGAIAGVVERARAAGSSSRSTTFGSAD